MTNNEYYSSQKGYGRKEILEARKKSAATSEAPVTIESLIAQAAKDHYWNSHIMSMAYRPGMYVTGYGFDIGFYTSLSYWFYHVISRCKDLQIILMRNDSGLINGVKFIERSENHILPFGIRLGASELAARRWFNSITVGKSITAYDEARDSLFIFPFFFCKSLKYIGSVMAGDEDSSKTRLTWMHIDYASNENFSTLEEAYITSEYLKNYVKFSEGMGIKAYEREKFLHGFNNFSSLEMKFDFQNVRHSQGLMESLDFVYSNKTECPYFQITRDHKIPFIEDEDFTQIESLDRSIISKMVSGIVLFLDDELEGKVSII